VPDLLCCVYVFKLFNILLSTSHVTTLLAPIVLTLRQLQDQGSPYNYISSSPMSTSPLKDFYLYKIGLVHDLYPKVQRRNWFIAWYTTYLSAKPHGSKCSCTEKPIHSKR
jgi:hypothetical protein